MTVQTGADIFDKEQIKAMLAEVRVTEVPCLGEPGKRVIEVRPVWKNVDRPHTSSYEFPLTDPRRLLVERVKRCMEDGVYWEYIQVCTGKNGQTFVNAVDEIWWKRLTSATLAKLGY